MKILYFDCYSGVSGDMILSALLDLGIDRETWLNHLKKLSIGGYEIEFQRTRRHGIAAQQVIVKCLEPQPERHLHQIERIIEDSDLDATVKSSSKEIFRTLARAEAAVHQTTPEKVHFHEVGAVDAIVDVVGCCIAISLLGVEKIYSSPVGVGQGIARSDHGMMALPPPATLEILRGAPLHKTGVETELATPTGAAILKTLAQFTPAPTPLVLTKVGYGAGAKEIAELPNVLRAFLMESTQAQELDYALLLETNIDDLNPEIYPYVMETILEAGAMDAYIQPIIMKKGRPGIVLCCLCAPELRDRILDILYSETTTLGVRVTRVERLKLARREVRIETSLGSLKGKESTWRGRVRRAPEFEDCKRIAREKGLSLLEVYQTFYRSADAAESTDVRKRKK
jgi:uncharacterized protein (TIGR00299 family) protein